MNHCLFHSHVTNSSNRPFSRVSPLQPIILIASTSVFSSSVFDKVSTCFEVAKRFKSFHLAQHTALLEHHCRLCVHQKSDSYDESAGHTDPHRKLVAHQSIMPSHDGLPDHQTSHNLFTYPEPPVLGMPSTGVETHLEPSAGSGSRRKSPYYSIPTRDYKVHPRLSLALTAPGPNLPRPLDGEAFPSSRAPLSALPESVVNDIWPVKTHLSTYSLYEAAQFDRGNANPISGCFGLSTQLPDTSRNLYRQDDVKAVSVSLLDVDATATTATDSLSHTYG